MCVCVPPPRPPPPHPKHVAFPCTLDHRKTSTRKSTRRVQLERDHFERVDVLCACAALEWKVRCASLRLGSISIRTFGNALAYGDGSAQSAPDMRPVRRQGGAIVGGPRGGLGLLLLHMEVEVGKQGDMNSQLSLRHECRANRLRERCAGVACALA